MAEQGVIVIDSGGTAIKVRLYDGQVRSFPGLRANSSLLPQLAEVVAQVAPLAGAGPLTVLVGTCALTARDNDPAELLRLCEPYGVADVALTQDSVTSFLGALEDRRGVVIAAGTGCVTLGVGESEVARVDGWGNIMGDAGGGYWIGREAIDAVMRAHDGRGPATALTEVVQRRFPALEDAYIELQVDPDWVRVVASFARGVVDLAAQDAVAAAICEAAGRHMAHSVATAVDRIGTAEQPNPLVSLIGGVLSEGAPRDSCIAHLRQRWPEFVPYPAQGGSLDGAEALRTLGPSHPLSVRIGRASHG
ncbi:MAG: hypothetical protein LCH76_09590 [Actinobacteria bacterium]|nr:hypothetical protein [Actinomycetota bacterium]